VNRETLKQKIADIEELNGELSFEIRRMKAIIADYQDAITVNNDEILALKHMLKQLELESMPIDMSFYRGTLNKDRLKAFIEKTDKPIRYTYGLKYRNPTTLNVPVSKERALQIVDSQSMLDAKELDDVLDLQAFSSNDMW
jgi:hypothetical protein